MLSRRNGSTEPWYGRSADNEITDICLMDLLELLDRDQIEAHSTMRKSTPVRFPTPWRWKVEVRYEVTGTTDWSEIDCLRFSSTRVTSQPGIIANNYIPSSGGSALLTTTPINVVYQTAPTSTGTGSGDYITTKRPSEQPDQEQIFFQWPTQASVDVPNSTGWWKWDYNDLYIQELTWPEWGKYKCSDL